MLGGRGRRGGGDNRAAVPKVELVACDRGQVRVGRAGGVGAHSHGVADGLTVIVAVAGVDVLLPVSVTVSVTV